MKKTSFEFQGKSVEEAIAKALKELKVKKDQVAIQLLSEEKRGLFGMAGAKPAKIRVSLVKNKEKA